MHTVFIADDEMKVINGLLRRVNWDGLDASVVGFAKNGREAEEKILSLNPDIIITDIFMPGLTGLELMERLEGKTDAVFIIFTAYSEFEYALEALQHNAADYLIKPVEISGIEEAVRKAQEKSLLKKSASLRNEDEYILQNILDGQDSFLTSASLLRYTCFFTVQLKPAGGGAFSEGFREQLGGWTVMGGKLYLLSRRRRLTLVVALPDPDRANTARKKITDALCTLAAAQEERFYWGLGCLVDKCNDLERSLLAAEEMLAYCEFNLCQIDGGASAAVNAESPDSLIADAEGLLLFLDTDEKADELLSRIQDSIRGQTRQISVMKARAVGLAYRIRSQFEQTCPDAGAALPDWEGEIISALIQSENLDQMFDVFRDMLHTLRRHSQTGRDNAGQRCIARVKQYIREHLGQNLNLHDLALEVNRNPSYLSYIFRQETGRTLFDYITEARMTKAQYLLTHTDMKIQDIARETGYEDQGYFSQVFKKYTGTTAGGYRRGV